MSDPLRSEQSRSIDEPALAEREARIEQLLLSGLDHYFAGQYEQAIHVWTRVVFLDRNHDRARAYIERARQALAEWQRESEELVHRGVAAYNLGQTGVARQLLNEAIARGGPHEVALAFLDRLNRIDAGTQPETVPSAGTMAARRPAAPRTVIAVAAPRRIGAWAALAAAVCTLAAGALFWWQGPQAAWLTVLTGAEVAPPVTVGIPPGPLPVPRSVETTLARAQTLYDGGRLHEALQLLAAVAPADPLRPEADRLRADIQRRLLAGVLPGRAPAAAARGGGAPSRLPTQ